MRVHCQDSSTTLWFKGQIRSRMNARGVFPDIVDLWTDSAYPDSVFAMACIGLGREMRSARTELTRGQVTARPGDALRLVSDRLVEKLRGPGVYPSERDLEATLV